MPPPAIIVMAHLYAVEVVMIVDVERRPEWGACWKIDFSA
tara:strand:+ start:1473 stop:1592 length:120 start_codon:yes stop_codon:yes gene_type:complete